MTRPLCHTCICDACQSTLDANTSFFDVLQSTLRPQSIECSSARATQENRGYFKQTHFPINSYVLVEYETRKATKLHTKRHGPYRVVNHIGTVYTLENLVTNKLKDFHVKLLTQYNHDEINSDIKKVAKIDEEFSEITQVLNHRFKGSKKNLANLELFLIWEDDPKPQWFPWNSSFRSVEVIHRYFDDNQMRRFIPAEFTWGKDHPEYIPPNRLKRQRS